MPGSLSRIDRIQLAVPDRRTAAEGWVAVLGAELDGEDRSDVLGARRSRLRLGEGFVELVEPDGPGPVADAVSLRGGHLFAAGVSTPDVEGLARRLQDLGVEVGVDGEQVQLASGAIGIQGLRLVLSPEDQQERVGDVDFLYEVTFLADNVLDVSDRIASLFDLERDGFVPIESQVFGYAGTLTLFDAGALHRLEVITPDAPDKTMGRFFERWGESYYMAFAESAELESIEARARERRVGYTPVPSERADGDRLDTLFLHPSGLGGVMLGLSRPTMAWQWSGHPEWVTPR